MLFCARISDGYSSYSGSTYEPPKVRGNLYKVMGVPRSASDTELRKAFTTQVQVGCGDVEFWRIQGVLFARVRGAGGVHPNLDLLEKMLKLREFSNYIQQFVLEVCAKITVYRED